jgi:hypothetical protein
MGRWIPVEEDFPDWENDYEVIDEDNDIFVCHTTTYNEKTYLKAVWGEFLFGRPGDGNPTGTSDYYEVLYWRRIKLPHDQFKLLE